MSPRTDLVQAASDVEELGAGPGGPVEHAETVARPIAIRRLGGRGALEKVPAEAIAVYIVILIVKRGLGIAEVALKCCFQPGLDGKRAVRIEVRAKGNESRHRAVLRTVIDS